MIWRSVVGKLWVTIIGLVTLVLLVMSLFLSEQITNTYERTQQNNLKQLAHHIQNLLQQKGVDRKQYLQSMVVVADQFQTHLIVLGPKGTSEPIVASPDVPWQALLEQTEIKRVYRGEEVILRGKLTFGEERSKVSPLQTTFPLFNEEVRLVAVPIWEEGAVQGAIILFQTLDQPQIVNTVFYSALIGIFLTTVFAFFLSTRITEPLIQMKKAAEKMATGEFSTRVPIRQHERDEIGDLAITINWMAEQLDASITAQSQEKEQLASILRSMADGVITVDAEGCVIVTNPPADRLFSALRNRESNGAIENQPDGLPQPLREIFYTVVQDEREHAADITVLGRTWEVVMAPLYDREQVRGAVAVLRDVTEERRLDKLRKDFVANVSHELRTPLAMLQGYSEALVDDIAESHEERRELAKVIHDESLRMGRLVNELLDLARMEAGHIHLERKDVNIHALVERVCRKFQAIAREQKVHLVMEDNLKQLPTAWWDQDKVEQILTNLIDNAIRHTPIGGTVTLRGIEENGMIHFSVHDTGTGIPESDLPFIFDRFYKADKARKRDQSGTGLGLFIVRHLVEAHGGTVMVDSQPGEGTTFTAHLPLKMEKQRGKI